MCGRVYTLLLSVYFITLLQNIYVTGIRNRCIASRGYVQLLDKCISHQLSRSYVTWSEAQQACTHKQGRLLTGINSTYLSQLDQSHRPSGGGYWLGGKNMNVQWYWTQSDSRGQLRSVSNVQSAFWAPGEPVKTRNIEYGMVLNSNRGFYWRCDLITRSRWYEEGFFFLQRIHYYKALCECSANCIPPNNGQTFTYSSFTYFVPPAYDLNRARALSECLRFGGQLTTIRDQSAQAYISSQLQSVSSWAYGNYYYWTSAYFDNRHLSTYLWTDGTLLGSKPVDVDTGTTGDKCIGAKLVNGKMSLVTRSCSRLASYVCEYPSLALTTSNKTFSPQSSSPSPFSGTTNMAILSSTVRDKQPSHAPETTGPNSCIGLTVSNVPKIVYDGNSIQTFCDVETPNGPWITLMRRFNGSQSFDKNWLQYKNGFGASGGEYWIGLETMHLLTKSGEAILRIDMERFTGERAYAEYSNFKIAGADEDYKLTIGGYSGTAGDMETTIGSIGGPHSGRKFSTKDRDNDAETSNNCAADVNGGWWMNGCFTACLTCGPYRSKEVVSRDNMIYYPFTKTQVGLRSTSMKIKLPTKKFTTNSNYAISASTYPTTKKFTTNSNYAISASTYPTTKKFSTNSNYATSASTYPTTHSTTQLPAMTTNHRVDKTSCVQHPLLCNTHASCKIVSAVGPTCVCNEGWSGNGKSCHDLDECLLRIDGCHKNGYCVNSVGSYACRCLPGYQGDGHMCTFYHLILVTLAFAVLSSKIRKILAFQALYDVQCSHLTDGIINSIQAMGIYSYQLVAQICNCAVSSTKKPVVKCHADVMSITWFTTITFDQKTSNIPELILKTIKAQIAVEQKKLGNHFLPVNIFSLNPPILYPKPDSKGLLLSTLLI